MDERRELLTRLFAAAVNAADPYWAIKPHFPKTRPKGRTLVVGFGKGSAEMGQAFERLWQEADFGDLEGFVVTRQGQDAKLNYLELLHAAHPVPDENSLAAAQRCMDEVAKLGQDDQLIALVSGGGSALLAAPAHGLTLDDKRALNQALLASGAPISVMNEIRVAASLIKGGRLSKMAHPAKVISYVISDVPGDDPALVSSGPTIASNAKSSQVWDLIQHYNIPLTDRLQAFFTALAQEEEKNAPDFSNNEVYLIASSRTSLLAAQAAARDAGIEAVLLSDAFEGEARDVAQAHGAIAGEISRHNQPFSKPVILLSGGETTVTLLSSQTPGMGGRNSEFALALSRTVAGLHGITALSADTDGIDGIGHHAGAFCDGGSVSRMRALGLDPLKALMGHDSASTFAKLGDLFITGPTGTNVNDFRAILVE